MFIKLAVALAKNAQVMYPLHQLHQAKPLSEMRHPVSQISLFKPKKYTEGNSNASSEILLQKSSSTQKYEVKK